MANFIKRVFVTECTKCATEIKRSEAMEVLVNGRSYQVCKQCAWDLENWLHMRPLTFGDYKQIEVKDESTNSKEP